MGSLDVEEYRSTCCCYRYAGQDFRISVFGLEICGNLNIQLCNVESGISIFDVIDISTSGIRNLALKIRDLNYEISFGS